MRWSRTLKNALCAGGYVWLAFGAACVAVASLYVPLRSGDVIRTFDTYEYLVLPSGWADHVDSMRTIAYKLVLAAIRSFDADYSSLLAIQLSAAFLAGAFLLATLRRHGASAGFSLAVVLPLVLFQLETDIYGSASALMTDSLAMTASLVVATLLLRIVHAPKAGGNWLGMALAVLFAYHQRPSLQYLVFLVPLAAWPMLRALGRRGALQLRPVILRLAVVCIGPWLAYVGARGATTGQYALAPIGGLAFSGAALALLTPELVPSLSDAAEREYATQFLRARHDSGRPAAVAGDQISTRIFTDNYSAEVFDLSRPIADRIFAGPGVPYRMSKVDQALGRVARQILSARPGLYAKLVAKNMLIFCRWLVAARFWAIVVACALAALLAERLFREPGERTRADHRLGIMLSWFGGAFAIVGMIGVSASCLVYRRYVDAAFVLLPGLFCSLVYQGLTARLRLVWARPTAREAMLVDKEGAR